MKVLSLFDGISCGQIALNRLNIKDYTYYASEINAHAISVTQKHYPNTVQLGSVKNWRNWDHFNWSDIDLIFAGFPCQSWSNLGTCDGINDPRGELFWDLLNIMEYGLSHNPNLKFLLENVKMKTSFDNFITTQIGLKLNIPFSRYFINSGLVSAQSRPRIYWTNINVPYLPENKFIFLRDILEASADFKYEITEKQMASLVRRSIKYDNLDIRLRTPDQKSNTATATYNNSGLTHTYINDLTTGKMRRFTPLEYERLQTIPDNYTDILPDRQRYHCVGNGWTVDVISHILSFLNFRGNYDCRKEFFM